MGDEKKRREVGRGHVSIGRWMPYMAWALGDASFFLPSGDRADVSCFFVFSRASHHFTFLCYSASTSHA